MWWPSFRSVLTDLWQFFWRLDNQVNYTSESTQPTADRTLPTRPENHQVAIPRPVAIHLQPNIRYDKNHDATTQIRSYLSQETTLKLTSGDLTAYEWLAYIYTIAGRPLPWLALALAPIGYWHQALKGLTYVSIGLVPKTQSLMEWRDSVQHGHIGYLTKVTPDDAVTVQELGAELPGALTEQTLSHEEWKELRPVFISVT